MKQATLAEVRNRAELYFGIVRPSVLWRVAALLFSLTCVAHAETQNSDGVTVGKPSIFRNLVPAQEMENQASAQYKSMLAQAGSSHSLATEKNSQLQRLRGIAKKLIPFAAKFNPRAAQWHWEVNLLKSAQINAFCMPGGKIAVFSGLIETLKPTDDELAIVIGHEIAHALREHARERMAKSGLTSIGASLLGYTLGKGQYADVFHAGGKLLTLKFSRENETDADIVGLELSARGGYDPRAGITLWEKMTASSKDAPPQWLSTHPSGKNRADEIRKHLPEVLPLYKKAS